MYKKINVKLADGWVPKTTAKQETPPRAQYAPSEPEKSARKPRTSYKVYGPHKGKPASAHYAGKIYTPQGQTKFKPGMRANMAMGSDGRLGVNNPETGDTEAWDVNECVIHDMLVEYALRCVEQLL